MNRISNFNSISYLDTSEKEGENEHDKIEPIRNNLLEVNADNSKLQLGLKFAEKKNILNISQI